MSHIDTQQDTVDLPYSTDRPAVGLVATADNTDWLAAEIIHVRRQGHQAIVTGTDSSDWRVYANALDAICVERPHGTGAGEGPVDRLISTARKQGYPGLLVQDDPTSRIDLERSLTRLQETDSYAAEAQSSARIPDATTVLAGIPAYNEAETIGDVVRAVDSHVEEVLVVDDGSEDRTAELAAAAGATVVEHDRNRGYGAALQTLFEQAHWASVDQLVVLDADSQHDPADIPKLLDEQRSRGFELVVGSRFVADGTTNAPVYRRLGLSVVNLLTNLSCGAVQPGSWVRDTQSGFRAYSATAVRSLAEADDIGDGMNSSTDILAHAHSRGFTIGEVGTNVDYDVDDANSKHPLAHGYGLVKNIYHTVENRRPLSVLGIPGLAVWFGGFWAGFLALSDLLSTGDPPVALGLLSGLLLLAGLLACISAVVLHSMGRHSGAGS